MAVFATADDVATRLGRTLTEAETEFAEQIIEAVTAQIAEVANEDSEWAAELDPVPGVFKTLCIEKVIAIGANPSGLASESETLGAHTHAKTFARGGDLGVFLTEDEKRDVRRAVRGSFRAVTLESPYSGETGESIADSDLPL